MLFVPPSIPFMVPEAEAETHTTPPLTVPADMTVTTSSGSSGTLTNSTGTFQLVTFSVTASNESVDCRWDNWAGHSIGLLEISRYFSVGTHTVTCSGGGSSQSFTITIIEEEPEPTVDTTPPTIVVSNNIYTQTTDPTGKSVPFATPSATDNVGVVTSLCNYSSGTFFPTGTTTVTCTASDAAGNTVSDSFTVTVTYSPFTDITPPVFMQVSSVTITTTDSSGTTYSYAIPQVNDNIGVIVGPTCTPSSGGLLPVGITTITCTAADAAGNQGSISFSVTVVNTAATGDTNIPTFAAIEDITEEQDVENGKQLMFPIP
ncbi:HYR domain-containing protein, partial [Marine Group I thaumarchaeote]|nr:HYR domain-containing protein [Marine Group I thaumarchaeote]